MENELSSYKPGTPPVRSARALSSASCSQELSRDVV